MNNNNFLVKALVFTWALGVMPLGVAASFFNPSPAPVNKQSPVSRIEDTLSDRTFWTEPINKKSNSNFFCYYTKGKATSATTDLLRSGKFKLRFDDDVTVEEQSNLLERVIDEDGNINIGECIFLGKSDLRLHSTYPSPNGRHWVLREDSSFEELASCNKHFDLQENELHQCKKDVDHKVYLLELCSRGRNKKEEETMEILDECNAKLATSDRDLVQCKHDYENINEDLRQCKVQLDFCKEDVEKSTKSYKNVQQELDSCNGNRAKEEESNRLQVQALQEKLQKSEQALDQANKQTEKEREEKIETHRLLESEKNTTKSLEESNKYLQGQVEQYQRELEEVTATHQAEIDSCKANLTSITKSKDDKQRDLEAKLDRLSSDHKKEVAAKQFQELMEPIQAAYYLNKEWEKQATIRRQQESKKKNWWNDDNSKKILEVVTGLFNRIKEIPNALAGLACVAGMVTGVRFLANKYCSKSGVEEEDHHDASGLDYTSLDDESATGGISSSSNDFDDSRGGGGGGEAAVGGNDDNIDTNDVVGNNDDSRGGGGGAAAVGGTDVMDTSSGGEAAVGGDDVMDTSSGGEAAVGGDDIMDTNEDGNNDDSRGGGGSGIDTDNGSNQIPPKDSRNYHEGQYVYRNHTLNAHLEAKLP